jgi:hypothetical protein
MPEIQIVPEEEAPNHVHESIVLARDNSAVSLTTERLRPV